jgi:hypothetical protein
VWSHADIADAVAQGLRSHASSLDLEQAVQGLDAQDERSLHPVLADALIAHGLGVCREQRYPSDRSKRRQSEGERCDLVLTPDGRALRQPDQAATLFDDPQAVELDDAYWLEVKVVAQWTSEGPNRQYASQLLSTVRGDVTKLSKDPGILHAGLLIVLFVADRSTADHDLDVWQERCVQRGLPIAAPYRRSFDLRDRLGNSLCMIALYPVSHL